PVWGHRYVKSVAKLNPKGLSERRIAAELYIPAGSVSPSSKEREMTQFDEQCEATIKTISRWPVILSAKSFCAPDDQDTVLHPRGHEPRPLHDLSGRVD